MNLNEAVRTAFRGLRANKLRSSLTMVGIVIGIAAVILLVGLGEGVKAGFNKSFGGLATSIVVNKKEGKASGGGPVRSLKDSDVTALNNRSEAPDLGVVTPVLAGYGPFRNGSEVYQGTIWGSTSEVLTAYSRQLAAGSMFTEADEKRAAKVVLLAQDPLKALFAGNAAAAINSKIEIGRATFTVIGVLTANGDTDDIGLMPLSTARAYLLGGSDTLTMITVKAESADQVPAAVDEVTKVLSLRHHIRDPGKVDFEITALQNQLDQINQFLQFLTLFIVTVAAISLLVGAIGVANIMLVSVTERTREIGIRKALGAPRTAIMKQFLIESAILAGTGGVIGIGCGVGLVLAVEQVVLATMPQFGSPRVSPPAMAAAFTVSLIIGLVAGSYPAFRAARLRPIEALRYE